MQKKQQSLQQPSLDIALEMSLVLRSSVLHRAQNTMLGLQEVVFVCVLWWLLLLSLMSCWKEIMPRRTEWWVVVDCVCILSMRIFRICRMRILGMFCRAKSSSYVRNEYLGGKFYASHLSVFKKSPLLSCSNPSLSQYLLVLCLHNHPRRAPRLNCVFKTSATRRSLKFRSSMPSHIVKLPGPIHFLHTLLKLTPDHSTSIILSNSKLA